MIRRLDNSHLHSSAGPRVEHPDDALNGERAASNRELDTLSQQMPLKPGERLGPYEAVSLLGAGGMGEVYKALDTRLAREVAVKVLPGDFLESEERKTRFEREARALAALNHPNIAAIYSFEEVPGSPGAPASAGRHLLVMELVEGEGLDVKIARGALSLEESLSIAGQIAEALEAAHAKGIVHRDLKPANVKVSPKGKVKLLDFGLAKAFERSRSKEGAGPGTTQSATLTAGATAAGVVLGTPAYMSPEQARGADVDARTDIWAFGCVLYELVTGRKAFPGASVADALAAVLLSDVDLSLLPPGTPPRLVSLLREALQKDPEARLREMSIAVRELAAARLAPERPAPRPGRLAQATFAEEIEEFPSWSPDGERLAFSRDVGPVRKIFARVLTTGEESPLTHGDFDDIQPAWSFDGALLLFVRGRERQRRLEPGDVFGQYGGADVWALDLATGRESLILRDAANPACAPDGRMAFDASWAGPHRLWVADGRGRNPQQVTSDVSEAVVHVRPRFSPDGRRIVFQNIERTKFDVRVVDVTSRTLTFITNDVSPDVCPVWSPSGDFIYFSSQRSGGLNVWRVPVAPDGTPAGPLQQLTTGAGQDVEVTLSPDGRRLAFTILKQNASLWRLPVDPTSGRPTGPPEKVVATTREDSRGSWSPDGRTIAFNSDRSGDMNIWTFGLEDGSARPVTKGPGGDFQPRFSPDGERLVFFSCRSGSPDVWSVETATGRIERLTRTDSIDVNPVFSPDGDQIAWQSDRSGRLEVWIMRADGSDPRRLTDVGVMGHFLVFEPGGRSVLFRCAAGAQGVMRISTSGGEPEPLPRVAGGSHISLSPGGSHVMDVVAHKALWVSRLEGCEPERIFEFDDPDVRIDYPVWSPDGRFVLFDRFRPRGGDIWVLEAG